MNSETSRPTNRNKLLALVSILSALLLVAVMYIVILESQNNQKESSNSNLVTRSESPASESSVTNNTRETTNNQNTTSSPTEPRDPNRYYNDKDGYSFIVPDSMKVRKAEDIYPKAQYVDPSIDYSGIVEVDPTFPEPQSLGNSGWLPLVTIFVDNKSSDFQKSDKTCSAISIGNFNDVASCKVANTELGPNSFTYSYRFSTDKKDVAVTGFQQNPIEKIVESINFY